MRRAPPEKRFRASPAASRRAPRATAVGLCGFVLVVSLTFAGCGREPPPRTVAEYLDDPTLLDATLGRCNRLPAGGRGEPDCDNARRAAQRLAAETEALQRDQLEAQSRWLREQRRAREDAEAQRRERAPADERSDEWERRRDSVRPSPDAPLQPAPGDAPPPAGAEPLPPSRTGPAPPAETQGTDGNGGDD